MFLRFFGHCTPMRIHYIPPNFFFQATTYTLMLTNFFLPSLACFRFFETAGLSVAFLAKKNSTVSKNSYSMGSMIIHRYPYFCLYIVLFVLFLLWSRIYNIVFPFFVHSRPGILFIFYCLKYSLLWIFTCLKVFFPITALATRISVKLSFLLFLLIKWISKVVVGSYSECLAKSNYATSHGT